MEADRVLGNPQTNCAWFSRSAPPLRLFRINRPTLAGVNWLAVFCSRPLAFPLEFRFCAEAQIRLVLAQQSFSVFAIDCKPVGLTIRGIRAAKIRPFVPIQSEPFEIGDELIFEAGFAAINIGILDTKYHGSALL